MTVSPDSIGQVEQLINEARHGSRAALQSLMQVCQAYLRQFAGGKLDPRLQTKVGELDLVQDSLLDAYRDFGQFRGTTQGELYAWLLQIARHNLRNIQDYFDAQMRQTQREVPLDDRPSAEQPLAALLDAGPSPSGAAVAEEQDEAVARAVQQLPDNYRQVVLLLHNWKELTYAEIGRIMNRSEEAVRKLWKRAIQQLSQILRTPP